MVTQDCTLRAKNLTGAMSGPVIDSVTSARYSVFRRNWIRMAAPGTCALKSPYSHTRDLCKFSLRILLHYIVKELNPRCGVVLFLFNRHFLLSPSGIGIRVDSRACMTRYQIGILVSSFDRRFMTPVQLFPPGDCLVIIKDGAVPTRLLSGDCTVSLIISDRWSRKALYTHINSHCTHIRTPAFVIQRV